MSTKPLSAIRDQLKRSFAAVTAFYSVLGQSVDALRKHGYTWDQVGPRIREWVGETQIIDLNDAYIRRAYDTHAKLFSSGALVSPDGKHTVLPEDAPSMGLNAKEWDRVADLIEASADTKHGPKLRVNQLADLRDTMQGKADDEKKAAAKLKFMQDVRAVEAHLAASTAGDELELARQELAREDDKLGRMQTALIKQRDKVQELREKVAALTPPPVEEPKAETKGKTKGKARPKHSASVTDQATA